MSEQETDEITMTMDLTTTTRPPRSTFVPGSYWTPARAHHAVAAMSDALATPEMQAVLNHAGEDFEETHTGELQQPSRHPRLTREGLTFERATIDDVPELTQVIVEANLPAMFIEEFIGGFAVARQSGRIIAAGGMEVYGDAGFLRSIAVVREARGLGLGRNIADLLRADARASRLQHLFLFTQDAYTFWKHVRFTDIALDAWPVAAQACWQWQYVAANQELMRKIGVHSMWRPV